MDGEGIIEQMPSSVSILINVTYINESLEWSALKDDL